MMRSCGCNETAFWRHLADLAKIKSNQIRKLNVVSKSNSRSRASIGRLRSIALGSIFLIGLALIAAPYLNRDALPFYSLSAESYGRFWPYATSMFPHILVGTIAIILGPLQFIGVIRRRYPKFHRFIGYTYLGAIIVGSISAFNMSFHIELTRTVGFAVGLFCLAVCWLATGLLAYWAIIKKNVALHQQLLAQNYALTFSFALTRWFWDLDISFIQNMGVMRYITMGWVGWVMPFALTGFYFQIRAIANTQNSS